MPGRGGTGSLGREAMKGRGLGVCPGASAGIPGCGRVLDGGRGFRHYGMRAGYGCRIGYRRYSGIRPLEISQRELLQEQKALLGKELDLVNQQVKKME